MLNFFITKIIKRIYFRINFIYINTFAQVAPGIVGTYTHALEELAVLESFILNKKIDVKHEQEVDKYGHKPDLTVQIDRSFRTQFAIALKKKYQIDLTNIKTVNFDFSNTYNKRKPTFITDKFFKNYQSKEAVSFIILTNNKLYDKDLAEEYIDSFDPVLGRMDPSLYPEHIKIITMDEFTSFFGISGSPAQSLQVFRKLKDQALSHNPKVSDEAFEAIFQLYTKAKLTLSLIKTDPANTINILRTKQLDLTKFLGNP